MHGKTIREKHVYWHFFPSGDLRVCGASPPFYHACTDRKMKFKAYMQNMLMYFIPKLTSPPSALRVVLRNTAVHIIYFEFAVNLHQRIPFIFKVFQWFFWH